MAGTGDDLEIPSGLTKWITDREGSKARIPDYSLVPQDGEKRPFLLTSVKFSEVEFKDHRFNPRTPNIGRVHELEASITSLGLLTPLTCAYVGPGSGYSSQNAPSENVVLIDGRHRYDAMVELRKSQRSWASGARIDLKIYYHLKPSDLFLLSTYLNRTRKALATGEYFLSIVKIFEEKKRELESRDGRPATEVTIFREVNPRAVSNRAFDLSIGRIVGLTAFDPEEGDAWYPMVGLRQQQRFEGPGKTGYCPMTAGNLATFLGHLCRAGPYPDTGRIRATEIENVLELGRIFRSSVIKKQVMRYDVATGTSVGCKHWCLDAFGEILQESAIFEKQVSAKKSPLSEESVDWTQIGKVVRAYSDVMDDQARTVNQFKGSQDENFLTRAWSYHTQRDQIKPRLLRALAALAPAVKPRGKAS